MTCDTLHVIYSNLLLSNVFKAKVAIGKVKNRSIKQIKKRGTYSTEKMKEIPQQLQPSFWLTGLCPPLNLARANRPSTWINVLMSLHQLLNKYFPFSYKNTINKKKRTKRAQNSSTQQINPDEKIKLYTFLTTTTRKIVLSCLHLDARRKCVDQELKKHFFPTLRERKKRIPEY